VTSITKKRKGGFYMKIKFTDYKIEHKGYWDYGYQYWLAEQRTTAKGKLESIIIITTNDLKEVAKKIQELSSQNIKMEFEENESFKKHQSKFLIS
jgi:hypothetical protein